MRSRTFAAFALLGLFNLAGVAAEPSASPATAPAGTSAYPFRVEVVGKGRPILFIPGLDCSGDVWRETVAHLSVHNECHVLTLGGFAGEPAFDGPFIDTVRDGIVRYIAERKLTKPAIIGHSIGGYLGYVLAIDAPDSVGPIVCVDGVPSLPALSNPAVTPDQLNAMADRMEGQFATMKREQFDAQQRMTLAMWIYDLKNRERAATWGAASDIPATGRAAAGLIRRDVRGEVAKIKSPLLLIAAAAPTPGLDPKTLRDRYEEQVKPVPDHAVAFAEKSHHFVMFDEPEWMMGQIDKFLAAHP